MSKEPLILKILDPTGIARETFELNWPADQLDRFMSGSKIVVEGDFDIAIYKLDTYKSDKNINTCKKT